MGKHTEYIIAAVVAILWWNGKNKVAGANQVQDSIPIDGTNFQGDLWQHLGGTDLAAPGYDNVFFGANASPSKVGFSGINAGWDGTINAVPA